MGSGFGRHSEEAIYERVSNMIQRGTIGTVDDAKMMQQLDVRMRNGYKPKQVEHWHPYGMSMHPKSGAEVLAFSVGGDMDHMVVIPGADRRYRVKVAEGEMAIHDDQGQVVHLKRGGIEITSNKPVTVKGQKIVLDGDVEIKGNIAHTGNMTTTGTHSDSAGTHGAL